MKHLNKRAKAHYQEELAKELGFKDIKAAIRAGYGDVLEEGFDALKKPKKAYQSYSEYLNTEYPGGYMQGRGASY